MRTGGRPAPSRLSGVRGDHGAGSPAEAGAPGRGRGRGPQGPKVSLGRRAGAPRGPGTRRGPVVRGAARLPAIAPRRGGVGPERAIGQEVDAAGFEAIEVEPTRVYKADDARQFLTAKGIDLDAIAPLVDGKVMSAFVRARKPGATN